MPLFVILIVVSLSFYIFYKVKEVRSKAAYEKSWIASKAKAALGLFLLSFGLNEFTMVDDKIQLWIAIIFTVYGLFMMVAGYKMYKHFLPLAIEEAERSRSAQ
ncbi:MULTISPECIES: YtpI family protein [Fictibacillus]|uniref:YtpI family protein n=1 Tax=Fictibacillus terranigra TaxID=3058424 RepID=A0ABT8E3Y1_9BACL|nr:YtpI family protein [Fictibacillus sp. CENA-BCM004]MDN4072614.1 YtpI family protein [Fictibacillus sp. CENA-BCM004]